LQTVRELLEKAEESARKAVEKATPAVQKSVSTSMDAAGKGFNATMKSIDSATTREQLELLKAYRKVLGGQVDYVDSESGPWNPRRLLASNQIPRVRGR